MAVIPLERASHTATNGQGTSRAIMGAGAIWLGLVAWYLELHYPFVFHGQETYDVYYAMLLEGRFDIPPRTIRFEGWYTADGTAYMYHGVAPLLTRFLFGWVWPFETFPMSGVSIWLWAVLGTTGYQSALTGLARRAQIWDSHRNAILLLCIGLWLAGPGLVLVSNHAFYQEPIAVSFGVTGLFMAVWVRWAGGRMSLARAVLLLAVLAAIGFHARPNVALALYAATGLVLCWGLWRYRMVFVLPALLSGAVLGGGGIGGYLALNEARLGSAAGMDGAHERTYGFRFWGREDSNSERVQAFRDHGRFNALRVLPNLTLYVVDVPGNWPGLRPFADVIMSTYRGVTEPILGFIRVAHPRIGILIMWPVWLYLALVGIRALRRDPPMATLACCMALSFGLTLAYGTVNFRYRLDLWPFIAVLALSGTATALAHPAASFRRRFILFLLCVGSVGSHLAARQYSYHFRDMDHSWTREWTYEYCIEVVAAKGFEGDDIARICRAPKTGRI